MKEVLLIIIVLGAFVYGYFLMGRLDKFLEENRKAIEKESEKKEPSCVMLTEDVSEEELMEEVRRFRKKHKGAKVMLYDNTDTELPKNVEYQVERKQ